jgi:hypothetical protein
MATAADGTSAALTLKVYRTVIGAIRIVGPGLDGEYLELRNLGSTDVNLWTWTLRRGRPAGDRWVCPEPSG